MDYVIDGFGIPTDSYLTYDGAVFFIPDNLPKEVVKRLKDKLYFEHDVVEIHFSNRLVAKFYGAAFQEAHDKLITLMKDN